MHPLIRMRHVFVPGGQPEHTYVARESLGLEQQLASASDNLCKLVTITGATKSGKSVLTKKVFPRSKAIWVDGGAIDAEDDLWNEVLTQLDGFTEITSVIASSRTSELKATLGTEVRIPFLGSGRAEIAPRVAQERGSTESRRRVAAPKTRALQALRDSKHPLVIDDFHYLERDMQGSVVRALKALVFDGHPVLLLAIPHRRYDAIRVEKEMTGRVQQVPVPEWTLDELRRIPTLGFPLLGIDLDDKVVVRFQNECISSPHLMQEFCRQLCIENGIEEQRTTILKIEGVEWMESLLKRVAADTSKTIFDRLAKGPQQRKDRLQRKFKDGRQGDLYVAVLFAIARLRPGMVTLDYEALRSALRELLEVLPQMNEVSRVLEYMGKIQADDAASAPVLDWDKKERRLHVTDPFFSFFLRWGVEQSIGPTQAS